MESTVSIKFSYEHNKELTPTPVLSMEEFIAQVKDKMVDKVKELDAVKEAMRSEESPIAVYGKLIDYQLKCHYPYYNVQDEVIPLEIFHQLAGEIFSYVKEGVIGQKHTNILFSIGNLEMEIGTEHKKFLKVNDTSEYHMHSQLTDREIPNVYEREMFEGLKAYIEEKSPEGRRQFIKTIFEYQLHKTGEVSSLRKLWMLAVTKIHFIFNPKDIQTMYENLHNKDENYRIRKEKIETGEKENSIRDEERGVVMNKYRLDLVIDAFRREGFKIEYVNIEEDDEIAFQ